ncbi:hypothetical protein ABK040_005006 [Willaertia magna]
MSTLLEEFLADQEDEIVEEQQSEVNNESSVNNNNVGINPLDNREIITRFFPSSKPITGLLQNTLFKEHVLKIKEFINKEEGNQEEENNTAIVDNLNEEQSYILASNSYTMEIDQEIERLFIQLKDLYSEKFKELENNISDPLDYAKTVLRIGNRPTLTNDTVNLTDILPPSTIMIIKVIAANDNSFRTLLSEEKWNGIESLCNDILELDNIKELILEYVSMRMNRIAPNLSVLVGTRISAQLIGTAGSLDTLAQLSGDVIQCLGRDKKKLEGMSSRTFIGMLPKRMNVNSEANVGSSSSSVNNNNGYALAYNHNDFAHMRYTGFVGLCDLVMQHTPPREKLRKKVSRIVATKCALAARIDSCNSSRDGSEGLKLKEDVIQQIKHLLEPPKGKQDKPLPAPDSRKKTNRGGKKSTAEKELRRYSELRKKYERLPFGAEGEDETYIGQGTGMLGKEGLKGLGSSQSLRLQQAILASGQRYENKMKKKQKQQPKNPFHGTMSVSGTNTSSGLNDAAFFEGMTTLSSNSIFKSGTATQIIRTGTASSVAITPQHEIEILNPNLITEEEKLRNEEKKRKGYFSSNTKFMKVNNSTNGDNNGHSCGSIIHFDSTQIFFDFYSKISSVVPSPNSNVVSLNSPSLASLVFDATSGTNTTSERSSILINSNVNNKQQQVPTTTMITNPNVNNNTKNTSNSTSSSSSLPQYPGITLIATTPSSYPMVPPVTSSTNNVASYYSNPSSPTTTSSATGKKYNTGGSSKKYVPSFFDQDDCIIGAHNYNPFDQQPIIYPHEVVISTKNLIFEKYHNENHLLSSLKYTLRVCTINVGLENLWVKLELVCGNTGVPIRCVKKERAGKRGIKGRCYQDFDVSKHGYLKAKLEFRFRETSSDNTTDKFRLLCHIYHDTHCLLTFQSPKFRTVVRSPQRGKFKALKEQLEKQQTIAVPYGVSETSTELPEKKSEEKKRKKPGRKKKGEGNAKNSSSSSTVTTIGNNTNQQQQPHSEYSMYSTKSFHQYQAPPPTMNKNIIPAGQLPPPQMAPIPYSNVQHYNFQNPPTEE